MHTPSRGRQVMLFANLAPGVSQGRVIDGVEQASKDMKLPAGYTAGAKGQSRSLSLLLALVATPVAYSLFDDATRFVRRVLGRGDDTAARERELAELDRMPVAGGPAAATSHS